jgi:hypothetical protein
MAKYTKAELQIVAFDAEDVITASNGGDVEIPPSGDLD